MPQKITQEKITQIIKLREFGCTFNDICKITKSSKRTVQRICNSNIKKLEYQHIKIPPNMKETQYCGYYVIEIKKIILKVIWSGQQDLKIWVLGKETMNTEKNVKKISSKYNTPYIKIETL